MAVVVNLVVLAAIAYFLLDRDRGVAAWHPTVDDPDPSLAIPGIVVTRYEGGAHVPGDVRVAYDSLPPYGGPHDQYWAACNGQVYAEPVRSENLVHSLEHGAVWIAYDPERVTGADVDALAERVQGRDLMVMSPFPGMESPVSLQAWGHRLAVPSVGDERIDRFVTALRGNPNTHPEVGASCDALGPGAFDPADPPPFDPRPYGGDTVPMDFRPTGSSGG